jgi:hypothetical protein
VFPFSTALEDKSSPSFRYEDSNAVWATASLSDLRKPTWKRKVGFWEAGTGRFFQPERWLNAQGEFQADAGPAMPFSAGPRGCFGKKIGVSDVWSEADLSQLAAMRLFITQISQAFFFAPVPDSLNGWAMSDEMAVHPVQCFVKPKSWDSPEAKQRT